MNARESAEQAAREREEAGRLSVWLVRFSRPVERLFVPREEVGVIERAQWGVAWAGIGAPAFPTYLPTDRPDVTCCQFGAPLTTLAVERDTMGPLMRVIRSNGVHGRYREAGTETRYEF